MYLAIIAFLSLFSTSARAATHIGVESVSRGPQVYGEPGLPTSRGMTVRVFDEETKAPLAGFPIRFSFLAHPPKAAQMNLEQKTLFTNTSGEASTTVTLGSEAGDYLVGARIHLDSLQPALRQNISIEDSAANATFTARKKGWPYFLLMELMAGLAFFMFGISQLSTGMRNAAGSKLRQAMHAMAHNRLLALSVGVLITVLFQSSCATTVMLVSFVQAGLLRSVETLAVILGADIGTTMTVQLFAFKITDYTLIAVAIGFFMQQFGKSSSVKFGGQAVLGLGLLFTGMNLMAQSTQPLRSYEPFVNALMSMNSTLPALLAGAVATAIMRSSAAFIGIVMVFASQGLVSLPLGVTLCLGANLGTCVTALLASVGASHEAKRVALAHMMFKFLGILLLVLWIPSFAAFVQRVSGEGVSIERLIANAHTIFNVGIALLFLPFLTQFQRLIEKLMPSPKVQSYVILDKALHNAPALALSAAKKEIMRMGKDAQQMVQMSLGPTLSSGAPSLDREALVKMERAIDHRYETIRSFLAELMERRLPEEQVWEVLLSMRTLHDIEQIADIVEDRLVPRIEILKENNLRLSDQGREEMLEYHTKVLKQISRSLDLFNSLDFAKATRISERFERYCMLAYELKNTHFQRLGKHIPESEQTSNVHLNLISALLDISNLATNIARHMKERKSAAARMPIQAEFSSGLPLNAIVPDQA